MNKQSSSQGESCCPVVFWTLRKNLVDDLQQFTYLLSGCQTKTPPMDEGQAHALKADQVMLAALKQS